MDSVFTIVTLYARNINLVSTYVLLLSTSANRPLIHDQYLSICSLFDTNLKTHALSMATRLSTVCLFVYKHFFAKYLVLFRLVQRGQLRRDVIPM